MKKFFLIFSIIMCLVLISLVVYSNDMQMNASLELRVPKITKRETIRLKSESILDDEELRKIYLSKYQMKSILKKIKKNSNWKNTQLDERLNERMNFFTRDEIYNKIPQIENAYWIFTNRSHGIEDKHSIDQLLDDMYYAVSLGILDIDNNILYYYEYDT